MTNQRIKKVNRLKEKLIRPLLTVLIVTALTFNIQTAFDTLAKNREVRQINAKLEKQIEQAEELQLKNEEVYLQKVEDNKRLADVINRLNLRLDLLDLLEPQ